jgi:hypothetical protein
MALDVFTSLLDELAELLKIKLRPDANNSCIIQFPDKLEVQIEVDSSGEWIVIGTTIGTLPPGKFREDFCQEALKANHILEPKCGIFAYAKKGERLVFFHRLPLKIAKGATVAEVLVPFLERTKKWKEMLEQNTVPTVRSEEPSSHTDRLFGLAP